MASRAPAECESVAHADDLVAASARIFVGELHGTREIPRVFAALVCRATRRGPVRVGLELPADEAPAIAAFLASPGTPADRAALLRGAFWTDPAAQDGRRSQAMAQLLDDLRQLRQAGADLDVATFDDPEAADRDRAMADRALAAIARAPEAIWLLLAGNLHARKTSGRWPQTFMAAHLVQDGVPLTTLDARYGRGSLWACLCDCGPAVAGRGPGRPAGVVLGRSEDGAYDGLLDVGAIHFSPPAALPMTDAQAARAASLPRQLAALDAYDARDWARCARLYDALAQEQRAADHAYNAACCHALGGELEAAFAALGASIECGLVDFGQLAEDSDLAALRADARWQPLVARAARASAK